jgi:hypothetical protein
MPARPLAQSRNRFDMSSEKFVSAQEAGPLGYSISTRRALCILFTRKMNEPRFQRLLAQWAAGFLVLVGVAVCAFLLLPAFWAAGALAHGICLFGLFVSIGVGDLFLQMALEDGRFFEMATQSNALWLFEDDDQSLSQSDIVSPDGDLSGQKSPHAILNSSWKASGTRSAIAS